MTTSHHSHLHDAGAYIVHIATDPIAIAASAGAAVSSPWWLPPLTQVHDVAAEFLPILGCFLASLQIVLVFLKMFGWVKG